MNLKQTRLHILHEAKDLSQECQDGRFSPLSYRKFERNARFYSALRRKIADNFIFLEKRTR